MSEFKKYYNTITKEIVSYPEEAAALFDVLKPVPSKRDDKEASVEIEPDVEVVIPQTKDTRNAK